MKPRRASGAKVDLPAGARGRRFSLEGEDFAVLVLPVRTTGHDTTSLTSAEREVARLVAHGLSNGEIASIRATSARTVANQLQSIFRKLGVGSRVELSAALASGTLDA